MDKRMTIDDFLGSIAGEGGVVGALEHGLSAEDVDDKEFRQYWQKCVDRFRMFKDAERAFRDLAGRRGYQIEEM